VLALLFSLVFLLFGLVAIVQAMVCRRSTNASQAPVWLAVSLFSLWPSAILHAPRLGNDAPFYAFSAVSMALTALWWRHREDRYLVWALLVAGGAMLTKSNGIVLVATIATLVVFTLWIERETSDRAHAWRTAVRAGLASLAAVVPPMALGWVRAAMAGSDALVGNSATINPALAVPNDLGHYVYVPLDTWLIEPFTDAGDDRKGRTFFLNYFGKTSLFGEFHLGSDPTRHNIAVAISALLVVLVVLLIRGLLRARRHDALWAIPLLLWLAAAVAFRARYPYSCSGDFRYVLPVLIPLCVGVASGLDHLRNPKVRWLAGASVIAFALLSGALTASIDAWP
jgi:4-amino-4-deoxy-L-arabinose transferase-like glycosyltransferase